MGWGGVWSQTGNKQPQPVQSLYLDKSEGLRGNGVPKTPDLARVPVSRHCISSGLDPSPAGCARVTAKSYSNSGSLIKIHSLGPGVNPRLCFSSGIGSSCSSSPRAGPCSSPSRPPSPASCQGPAAAALSSAATWRGTQRREPTRVTGERRPELVKSGCAAIVEVKPAVATHRSCRRRGLARAG